MSIWRKAMQRAQSVIFVRSELFENNTSELTSFQNYGTSDGVAQRSKMPQLSLWV